MPRHFKVHEHLSGEELEEFELFAREPGRTVDECHEWMEAKGYVISRSAVGAWKSKFDEQVMADRLSRSGELARAMKGAVKDGAFEDVADAALMQLTQVVFEQSTKLDAEGKLDPLEIQRMTKSLNNLAMSKEKIVALLAGKFDREIKAKQDKRPDGVVTPEDIAEARRAIFGS